MMTVTMALGNEEEAQALMLHHLRLAALFFENTPAKITIPEEHATTAFSAFCEAMEALYPDEGEW